mgnify:CR=1 FL=1
MKPDIEQYSLENLIDMTATKGRISVKTQYACQVIGVSEDGRFVDLVHNTLEWTACVNGDTVMRNSFGRDVLCSPKKPWVVRDIPVEETYERGQWKVRCRPRVGDKGILSVFYHDIRSLKEKGGFQAPEAIRVMAIDSASWRPGLPNHADVNADPTYPSDDEWELNGNGVKIKLTSPVDSDSQSSNKMDVTVGTVQFTIEVPQNGTPVINFNAPDGAITVNSQNATVNLTGSGTLSATSGTVTIDTPTTTITGELNVGGAVKTSSTIDSGGDITSGGDVISSTGKTLDTHRHPFPYLAGTSSATGTTDAPSE